MTKQAVVSFNCICFSFRLFMQFTRYKFFVGFPIICFNTHNIVIVNLLPKLHSRLCTSCTKHDSEDSFPKPINSQPDPAVVFFSCMYVWISSISTTSILFSTRLIWSIFFPNSRTQFITLTLLTLRILSIERNPKPSRYNSIACRFKSGGLPLYITVKRNLQLLHKKRCLPFTMPSLTIFDELHFGQFMSNNIYYLYLISNTPFFKQRIYVYKGSMFPAIKRRGIKS